MEDDGVFRALSDPNRRLLLDHLFERDGRTLTELEAPLAMTRFGVMKHLRILEEAGLVTTRKVGRAKLHYLNPVPIQLLYDRWIGKYAAGRLSALADLKTILEGEGMTTHTDAKPKIVNQVMINASPERIWEALTKPEFTERYFYGSALKTDLKVGSPFNYLGPDGSSTLIEGKLLVSDPPKRLSHTYRSLWGEMGKDAPTRVTWELEAMQNGVTKVTVIHDEFAGETETYAGLLHGDGWTWILSHLKSLLETGEPMPAQY